MTLDHEHDSSVDIDEDMEDYDEAQGFSYGVCRACRQSGNCSNDSGYCTDCD